jgi:cytochrome P450
MTLPPGPRVPWLPLLQYAISPYRYVQQCAREFGDPFTVKTPYGPLVVTGRPSHVREILRLSDEHTEGLGSESVRVFLGDGSVMLMGGLRHREERKILHPLFSVARTGAYAPRIYAMAQEELHKQRDVFSMREVTQEISLSVIIEVVFGIKDPARIKLFRRALHEQIAAINPVLFFAPQLRVAPFGLGPWARYQRAFHSLNRLIEEEIELRRREQNPSPDLLTGLMLAQQSGSQTLQAPNAIRDELVTMLIAGHETTGLALAWAFYWIHKYQHIRERLLAELSTVTTPSLDALNNLPFLDAVCQESLRLFPVVPEFLRQLLVPQSLFGYQLPAQTGLAVSVSLLHSDPELYPTPNLFRPERFLERSFAAYEYAPFGGGAYRCVGAGLAMQEMKLVLASVLQNYTLSLSSDKAPTPQRRNWVIGPSSPIWVRASRSKV